MTGTALTARSMRSSSQPVDVGQAEVEHDDVGRRVDDLAAARPSPAAAERTAWPRSRERPHERAPDPVVVLDQHQA